jgi:hypothetical protein
MRKVYAFAVIATALAGCATVQVGGWVRPGVSQEQAVRDYRECDYEATKATAGVADACSRQCAQLEVLKKCMELRGYHVEPPLR